MKTLHKTQHESTSCYTQITGQCSVVIIREDGHCEPVTFQHRIREGRPHLNWVGVAAWLIPAVIFVTAMLMAMTLVAMAALGRL